MKLLMFNHRKFFRNIVLICFLVTLSFVNSFGRYRLDTEFGQETLTQISNTTLLDGEDSKLTETKKGKKRSYQQSSTAIPSVPTPVEFKTYSTVNTATTVMDVETVKELKAILNDVNNSQNISQETIAYALLEYLETIKDLRKIEYIRCLSKIKIHQELNRQNKRKAKAYFFWPGIFILSTIAFVYFTRTDRPEGKYISLVIATVSFLALIGLSSNLSFLSNSEAEETINLLVNELGNISKSIL